jgi:hypothetical protein
LEAGLRQSPAQRKTKPEPVDQEYIGQAVEQTAYRKRLRRQAVLVYFQHRLFTDDEATSTTCASEHSALAQLF